MTLQQRVDAAMAQAMANGFNMAELDRPELVACDLMDCDADFSGEDYSAVTEACKNWLDRQGAYCSFCKKHHPGGDTCLGHHP